VSAPWTILPLLVRSSSPVDTIASEHQEHSWPSHAALLLGS
jgi:hypothetical protein